MQTVQHIFIDALTAEPLTWAPGADERRRVAELIAMPLLQKLGETLEPVVEQIQRETALVDTHNTSLNIEKTVSVLEEIRDAHKPHPLEDNEIAVLRQQYRNDLHERWKMLDFRGIMHVEMHRPMGIPLTEVFICPDVLVGVPEYETVEREEELRGDEKKTQKTRDYPEDGSERQVERSWAPKREKQTVLQRESLSAVLGKSRRLVILGHPGAGKSTLLRYFVLRLARDPEEFAKDFPHLMDVSLAVPFYMPLAAYAEFQRSNPAGERSLKQFLPRYLSENSLESYSSFLQNQLEQGRVFLLLDGLDEIPDAAFRTKIVQQIEALTQSYPQNHFIVTSRIVGYKEVPLAADYQAYTLADFNQQQIETFTRKWCPAYESWVRGTTDQQRLHQAATTDAGRLFEATQRNQGVKKLAVNPLLLTILALIQRQGIELPGHRVELFYRCTETLLDTWITAKGQALPFSKRELIQILRPLAFWMHQQRTVGAIPEEDLAEQIVKQVLHRKITTNEGEALKLAEAFLKTVRGQTGILVERGKERYGFLHQTFEEYFAARELEIRPDRNDFIKQHLHEARWREVILLKAGALGILHSNEEGVTELIKDIIMQAQSPFEEWLHRDLLFAGLCLADDVGVSVSCENEIVEEIVLLYLTSPYDSLRDAFSDVLTAWNGTPVGRKAARLILSMFRKQEILTGKAATATTFQEKLREYYQRILNQSLQALAKLSCLQIITLLSRLQIEQNIITNPVEYGFEQLSDTFYIVREAAATLLGQLGISQSAVIDGLVKTLSDPDEDVRKSAASALGQLSSGNGDQPEVVKALLNALTDPDEGVRQAAALALGKEGSAQPEVIEALLHRLSDSDSDVSQASVTALGQLSNLQPAVAEILIRALAESDWRVREGIAKIFGELSNDRPEVIEVLIHTLADPNDEVRQAVIESLGRLGVAQNPVLDALLLSLSNRSWQVRQAAAIALGQLGNSQPEVVKVLAHALSDVDEDVRLAAATALGQLRSSQPEMTELLLHAPSLDMRQAAAIALGHIGNTQPEVIEALLHMLSDSSWQVRQAASTALGQLGYSQPEVAQALLRTFSDSDRDVRQAAANSLGRLGNSQPEVVRMLVHALSDTDEDVRQAAITALGLTGNAQPEVIEALLHTLSDSDEDVRQAAATALPHMETTQPSTVKYLLDSLSDAANQCLPQKSIQKLQQELYKKFTQRQVQLLGEMGTGYEQVVEILLHILANPTEDKEVRQAIALALGQLKNSHPEVVDTLLRTLANSDYLLRRPIITALGQLEVAQPRVIDTLLLLLSDRYPLVRESSASALSKIGAIQPSIFDSMIHALSDSHSYTADHEMMPITLGLAGISRPEVVKALLQITNGFSAYNRREALRALGRVGSSQPEVVRALLQALSDTDRFVRVEAAEALGRVGSSQPEVVRALLQALSDTDRFIRRAAAFSLANLQVDRTAIPSSIGELLRKESSLSSNQFEANDATDALLFALYQVIEKV